MSRIFCVNAPKVKPTRRTPRLASHFGAGLITSHTSTGRKPYTQADLDTAAAMFGESSVDFDVLAAESAAVDSLSAGYFHA